MHRIAIYGLHLGLSENVDTGFLIFIQQHLNDLLIKVRQDCRHRFDDRYRHTEFVIEGRKLHADHSTAYDDHRLRQFGSRQSVCRIPHSRVVLYARDRWHEVRRARTDHQVLCFVDLPVTLDPPKLADIIKYFRLSAHHRAVFVIEALFDAGYEFANDDGLAFLHCSKIEGHVFSRYTIFLCVRSVIVLFGTVQERFGRNTTYVQAGSA